MTSELDRLRGSGLLRELRSVESAPGPRIVLDGRDVLLLCSNDYLGLAGDPRVRAAAAEAAQRWGAGTGSSRLVSGALTLHAELEAELADFMGTEACLLAGSGYLANLAVITALTEPGDVVYSDALNHASIIDACRLSPAETVVYDHLIVPELDGRAATIVTDAVFSMDGDVAPLEALRACGGRLIVDAAHHTGVVAGRIDADVVVGTLSKALGSYGAFIACDAETRALLVNRARPIIYSTSLPPAAVGAARVALALLGERMPALHANARVLREALGVEVSDMPIVPLVYGEPRAAVDASERALEAGIFAQAIRPPTVPAGTSRLRLTARADHDPADLRAAGAMLAATNSSRNRRYSDG